ncbi:MAG: hypothetical protein MUO26_15675 [Methanotrichaceae archaeon]|nr:hypothetical protein [Methanotrichaceae archaeon]
MLHKISLTEALAKIRPSSNGKSCVELGATSQLPDILTDRFFLDQIISHESMDKEIRTLS